MQKQKGMTLIGMLMTAAVVVMAAIVVLQVIPVYLQHYSIISSIKALSDTPPTSLSGDEILDQEVLKRDLDRRFEINSVDKLDDQKLAIKSIGNHRYSVNFKYKVVRHLVYNVNLLFLFDDTVEVKAGSEN